MPKALNSWLDVFEDLTLAIKPDVAKALRTGVTELSLNGLPAAPGGVCRVEGHMDRTQESGASNTFKEVVVLVPEPWTSISYGASSLSIAVGRSLQALQPKAASGSVAPSRFSASCTHPTVHVFFDVRTGLATINGFPVFHLDIYTGALMLTPSANLTDLFDSFQESLRASLHLSCTVWGHFEWQPGVTITPATGDLAIIVEDDVCWKLAANESATWLVVERIRHSTMARCRAACRKAANCGVYGFAYSGYGLLQSDALEGECQFLSPCLGSTQVAACQQTPAWEKIGNCSRGATCLVLSASTPFWIYEGTYCPIGWGINQTTGHKVGQIYHKQGLTTQDSFYLQPAAATSSDCSPGSLVLTRPNTSWDFENTSMKVVELHGEQVACLSAATPVVASVFDNGAQKVFTQGQDVGEGLELSLQSPTCGTGELNFSVDGREVALTSYVQEVLLDNPTTETPNDFSVHPCECFPEEWGVRPPVRSSSFKLVPPGSSNVFSPPHITISEGAAFCEQAELLTVVYGESTPQPCLAKCQLEPNCTFFWAGTLDGSKQCRLYSGCRTLVLTSNARGTLAAIPSAQDKYCVRADPQACFAIRQRRTFLGAGTGGGEVPGGVCLHEDLARQCDWLRMLGVQSVESCYKCDFALPGDLSWQQKVPLPTFTSGWQLKASCWTERYTPVAQASYTVTCAAGRFFGPSSDAGFGSFECAACIQLVQRDYSTYQLQNHQELYFAPSVQMQIFGNIADDRCLEYVAENDLCMQLRGVGALGSSCVPNPGEYFLCTAGVDYCLYDETTHLQLKEHYDCPASIALSDFGPCSAGPKASEAMEDASLLLQARFRHHRQEPLPVMCVFHAALLPGNYRALTLNGTDSSTWRLTTGTQCLEESKGLHGYELQLADCGGVGAQRFSEDVLRQALRPPFFSLGKKENACPNSSKWPTCDLKISGCRDHSGMPLPLAAFSVAGSSPVDCANTPVTAKQSVLVAAGAVKIRNQRGHCLRWQWSASGRWLWGSCQSPLSLWTFVETSPGIRVLELYDTGSCLFLSNSVMLISCPNALVGWGSSYSMSFNETRGMLVQTEASGGELCFGSEGIMDCQGDGQLSLLGAAQTSEDFTLQCPTGTLMSGLLVYPGGNNLMNVTCVTVAAMGSCAVLPSTVSDSITVNCQGSGKPAGVQSVTFQKSLHGWSVTPTCCYVEPLIMGLVATGTLITSRLQDWEGVYCPAKMDISGRLQFQQRSSFHLPGSNQDLSGNLSFDIRTGNWCLKDVGCAASDAVDPVSQAAGSARVGIKGASWEAVAVTDFNGQYDSTVSTASTGSGKRHPPKLIQFHADVPKVASECKEEVPDWDTVGKTLSESNPCLYVTGEKAKTAEEYEEGKGKGPANWWAATSVNADYDPLESGRGGAGYSYSNILSCWSRLGERNKALASTEETVDHVKSAWDMLTGVGKMACAALPYIVTAPLGVGTQESPGKMCSSALGSALISEINTVVNMLLEETEANKREEDAADCNGNRAAFARMWCDIHCVRSAVQEGDAAILSSLAKAVNVLDINVERIVQYYTGIVDDKVDALAKQKKKGADLPEVKAGMAKQLALVKQLLQKTPLDSVGRVASGHLLQIFMQGLQNRSDLAQVLEDVDQLQASVAHVARGHAQDAGAMVAENVARAASKMQDVARARSHVLGVYSHRNQDSKNRQRQLASAAAAKSGRLLLEDELSGTKTDDSIWQVLLQLDTTWWALRAAFDKYLDQAKMHAETYQRSARLLQDYLACSAHFAEVKDAYGTLMASENAAEAALKEAWSSMLPLTGLLVSKVVDSNALIKLSLEDVRVAAEEFAVDGADLRLCQDPHVFSDHVGRVLNQTLGEGLMAQTALQVSTLFGELLLLRERSPEPLENMDVLQQSLERILESLQQSQAMQPLLSEKLAKQVRAKFCEDDAEDQSFPLVH
ncbi:unnamed protein product [Symbiodinium natans]|uniref:Uncharacterized protein n=1 Tax=Symbiodinium natans TaxID=878477 RepID=A0A812HU01_9DINO|nr:unnamed protein product [Symbiodinium natans]